MPLAKEVAFKNFDWTYLSQPNEQEIWQLQKKFGLHPLHLAECLSKNQRSRVEIHPDYTFVVFLFPIYDKVAREITPYEMSIFISKKFLITIDENGFAPFMEFFKLFELSSDLRKKYVGHSPEKILYELLNKIIPKIFPILDQLSVNCDNIEHAIFHGKEKRMVTEILIARRNITDTRKIVQVHRNTLEKMVTTLKNSTKYDLKKSDTYFDHLVDYTTDIWDSLDNLRERIVALQETNESQISFRLSDIMRVLTIISVLTFPITLLATIFGMNTIKSMPFVEDPNGFWIIIGLMMAVMVTMLAIFKKKGWM